VSDLLPFEGSSVSLVVDDDRVRARVVERGAGQIDLTAPVAPAALQRAGTADGRLEFVAERGPCRLLGAATLLPRSDFDDTTTLRVRFTHDRPGQLLLQRERVRATFEVAIDVQVAGAQRTTQTLDLRGGGALLRGPLEATVGDLVRFVVNIPGRQVPIEGDARVARVTDEGDVAIHFGQLTETERDDLMLAVFEAQRGEAR
jgi:hypothetical protein